MYSPPAVLEPKAEGALVEQHLRRRYVVAWVWIESVLAERRVYLKHRRQSRAPSLWWEILGLARASKAGAEYGTLQWQVDILTVFSDSDMLGSMDLGNFERGLRSNKRNSRGVFR